AKLGTLFATSTGDIPQNVSYAIKSNYAVELASVVDGLEKNLAKPRPKPFPNTEQLAAFVSKSIALVIADVPDAVEKTSVPQSFPRLWKSLSIGTRYAVQLNGEYLQFEELSS